MASFRASHCHLLMPAASGRIELLSLWSGVRFPPRLANPLGSSDRCHMDHRHLPVLAAFEKDCAGNKLQIMSLPRQRVELYSVVGRQADVSGTPRLDVGESRLDVTDFRPNALYVRFECLLSTNPLPGDLIAPFGVRINHLEHGRIVLLVEVPKETPQGPLQICHLLTSRLVVCRTSLRPDVLVQVEQIPRIVLPLDLDEPFVVALVVILDPVLIVSRHEVDVT